MPRVFWDKVEAPPPMACRALQAPGTESAVNPAAEWVSELRPVALLVWSPREPSG